MAEKIYFTFKSSEKDWYYWLWQNGDIIRFPGQPKFIVQALVQKFWAKKWEQVFIDFMAGMEELSKLVIPNTRKAPPAWLVLYVKYKDAYKDYEPRDDKKIYDREKES